MTTRHPSRPRRLTTVAVAALAAAVVSSGCAKSRVSAVAVPRPVVQDVALGTMVELYGVKVDVLDIATATTYKGVPRITVTIRTENTLDRRTNNPDVQLFCDEAKVGGQWYEGSTWEANALLPVGVVNEGQIIIGFPPKPGAPAYSVASCTHPTVHVIATRNADGAVSELHLTVPDTVITQSIAALD